MEQEIVANLKQVHARINRACAAAGRRSAEVQLLLATKTVTAPRIRMAIEAGERLIAENKAQELKEKYPMLTDLPHDTHFIGHLQRNKIKDVLPYAGCIQSLDRLPLAEKINDFLQRRGQTVDVLLQVNTSRESSKFGIAPEAAIDFARQVARFPTLRIKGLMTIGLFDADADKVRGCFRLLREIQQKIRKLQLPEVNMDTLSMGMSGDLEIAIDEGATIVRVGTAIFGRRSYPDSYYWNESSQASTD